jgi:molybdenum cofactor synthesis domain-containing protein
MSQSLEIICIGNELLIGKTLNTNAQWLAKRITSLGLSIHRITVVGDIIEEISNVLKEAIHRDPTFIITTGGLGPTFDDITLEGLATALGCRTEFNEEALKMLKDKYISYQNEDLMDTAKLTPHRLKMAKLPEGAQPLHNPVGTAPAVFIEHENVTIITLPGVPSELKSIFDRSVANILKGTGFDITFFETSIYSIGVMESVMAPLIEKVMKNNPQVYVKSHPKGTERIPHIEFHLSTTSKNNITARIRVFNARNQLIELIQENGGKLISLNL